MDSETLEPVANGKKSNISFKSESRDDFPSIFMDLLKKIPIKKTIWLLLVGMLIFSDLFVIHVLSNFSDTTDMNCANTKGTMIQLLALCISYMFIDILAEGGIL